MAHENLVVLMGYAGKDPEVKEFPNGGSIVRLSMGTSDSYIDKSGARHESTEWHTVIFRNSMSKYVSQNVKKGYGLYVRGKIKTRSYDKDGIKTFVTEIHADSVQITSKQSEAKSSLDNVPEANE